MTILSNLRSSRTRRRLEVLAQCALATAILAVLTCYGFVFQINSLTIGMLYLLVVVAAASLFGFKQASYTSVVAVLLLDYYFEPPFFSFEVESPAMFVALATFEVTALAIARLQAKER